jgi:prophage regulatory protein
MCLIPFNHFGDLIMATQQNTQRLVQFYRLPALKEKLGISGSHIWAMVKAGTFPKPIKLSPNCTAWNSADVERWAQERIAESK